MAWSHGPERFWSLRQEKEGKEGQKGKKRKEEEVDGITIVYLNCDNCKKAFLLK